jgi:Tfp pilus assembly protein PilO
MNIPNIPFLSTFLQDKDKQVMLILIVLVAVLIAYIIVVAFPQLKGLLELTKEIQAVGRDTRTAVVEVKKIGLYEASLEENKAKFASCKNAFLEQEGEIPNLLERISIMARDSGVKISGIKPARTPLEGPRAPQGAVYKEVSILIGAKSGYHEIGELVSRIENAEKFLKVADISIVYNKGGAKKHDVTLLISAYMLTGE